MKRSIYNLLVKEDENYCYVFNTNSGNMAKIDKKVYYDSFISLDNDLVNQMSELGILVPKEINEINAILKREKFAMLNKNPERLDLVIAPTMLCNLKCIYCFEENSCKKDGFTSDVLESVLNYIKKYIKSFKTVKTLRIKWFGGEPLLKLDAIVEFSKKIIEFCEKNNISYMSDIITNGILLTKENAIIIKEQCKIYNCQVTLDGFEQNYCRLKRATKEQYNSVIKNICDVADILKINIRLNANQENFSELKQLTKYLLKDLKLEDKVAIYVSELKSFECNEIFDKQKTMDEKEAVNCKIDFIKYIRDELKLSKYYLPLPKAKECHCLYMKQYNFIIGPMGEFYRCEHMIGHEDFCIGDSKIGFYNNDYELSEMELQHEEKCYTCPIFPVCLGGCRDERKHIPLTNMFCNEQINYVKNLLLIKLENLKNNNI